MSIRDLEVLALAHGLTTVLRSWLSEEEFAEMKRRNEEDPAYADGACASHDFCDANMAMMEAWDHVMRRELLPADEDSYPCEDDCRLWGDAWTMARELYLGRPRQ